MIRSEEFKHQNTTYLQNPGAIKPKKYYKIINANLVPVKETSYHVTFRISEACDLACSYCDWHGGKHYKYEDIIGSIDAMFEFFKKESIKTVIFYYHGGEATRHPKIINIMKHVHQRGEEYNITAYNELQTNLTLSISKIKHILENVDILDITFHYIELTKRRYKLESFIRNFNYIQKENININSLDIMLEKIEGADLEEFRNYVLGFLDYSNITHSEMIYGFGYDFDHNDETATIHYEFYKKHNKSEQQYEIDGNVYSTNELFQRGADFTGWHCDTGIKNIYVNGDGNVYQCGIAMTNNLHGISNGIFTNLLNDKLALTKMSILRKSGTMCRWDYCGGDFYLPKDKK